MKRVFQMTMKQYWLKVVLICAALVCGAGLAFLQPLYALVGGFGVLVAALVFRWPWLGVCMTLAALPLERIGAYESAFGTIRASQLLGALTILSWLTQLFVVRRSRVYPVPILVPLLCFFAVCVVGMSYAPNLQYSLGVFALTVFTGVLAVVIPQIIYSEQRLRTGMQILLIVSVVAGVFGIFQFFGDLIGLPTTVTGLRDLYTKDVFGFPRVQSTFLEPLYFANFLLIPLGVTYAALLRRRAFPLRWTIPLSMLFGANLILTVSRGGYLGAVIVILIVTAASLKQFLRPNTIAIVFASIAIVVSAAFAAFQFGDVARVNIETLQSHVQNIFFGASYNERVETFEQAIAAFQHSPIVGIGPGSFGPFVATYANVKPESGWKIVNNEVMEIIAETGILGFLAWATLFIVLVLRSIRALRQPSSPVVKTILVGLFAALLGVLAQYQTFSTLYITHIWVLIGLLIAAQNIALSHHYAD